MRVGPDALDRALADAFFYADHDIERWVGFVVTGMNRYWTPPISLEGLVERDGYADCAYVSLGLRSRAGDWLPTKFLMYYDPDQEAWHIDRIGIVNAPDLESAWDY